jgi:hypothetical protein
MRLLKLRNFLLILVVILTDLSASGRFSATRYSDTPIGLLISRNAYSADYPLANLAENDPSMVG